MMAALAAVGLGLALLCCVSTAACAVWLGVEPEAGLRRRLGSAIIWAGATCGGWAVTATMLGLVR